MTDSIASTTGALASTGLGLLLIGLSSVVLRSDSEADRSGRCASLDDKGDTGQRWLVEHAAVALRDKAPSVVVDPVLGTFDVRLGREGEGGERTG